MKHSYLALFLLSLTTMTHAAFIDVSEKRHTVAELPYLKSGEEIVVKGQIQKHLHKDQYQFADATGQTIVEIKDNRWGNTDVTSDDTVNLTGKIEKDFEGIVIKVTRVDLVK